MCALRLDHNFVRLVLGPMKSGKSTEAIRIADKYARYINVLVVNSSLDTRHPDSIVTHSGAQLSCVKVTNLSELETNYHFCEATLIIIDEAQFFDDLYEHVSRHHDTKSYVIASLNGDAKQQRFGQVADLLPLAESVEMLSALCEICRDGTAAHFTIASNVNHDRPQIDVDQVGGNKYLSVCKKHIA